jgi:hypothetical protein
MTIVCSATLLKLTLQDNIAVLIKSGVASVACCEIRNATYMVL